MTGISRRTFLLGAAAVAAGSLSAGSLAACTQRSPSERVTMACGEPGGIYVEFGDLIGQALLREKNIESETRNTNGSAENLQLLSAGEVDLGLALADSAAAFGTELVAIGSVYQNYLQCIVRDDDGLESLSDLAGTRVSTGATGSGSSFTTRRLLAALDMDSGSRAARQSEHELSEALDALNRGEIDAMFWSSGIPTPKITELHQQTPLRLIDLSPAFTALNEHHPGEYLPALVPAGVYGAAESLTTIGVPNYLLAHPDLSDSVARALVEVLIHEAPSLIPDGTVGLQFLTSATLIDTGAVSLHPAALQRYRELYG